MTVLNKSIMKNELFKLFYAPPATEVERFRADALICDSPDTPGQNFEGFWDFVEQDEREF